MDAELAPIVQGLRRLQADGASRIALSMLARQQGVAVAFADPAELRQFEAA